MARDSDGNIIDPCNGRADLEDRVLRHVSDAFVEDPLRVLRVARFLARFHDQGFSVAEEYSTDNVFRYFEYSILKSRDGIGKGRFAWR